MKTKHTLRLFNQMDLFALGIDTKLMPKEGVQFSIATQRYYVEPNSPAHTWLTLQCAKSTIVKVEYTTHENTKWKIMSWD